MGYFVVVFLFYSRVLSCGVLETPRFGRKLSFDFTPGAKVAFECNEGFVLMGDQRRECNSMGLWNMPEYGYTECLRKFEFFVFNWCWVFCFRNFFCLNN